VLIVSPSGRAGEITQLFMSAPLLASVVGLTVIDDPKLIVLPVALVKLIVGAEIPSTIVMSTVAVIIFPSGVDALTVNIVSVMLWVEVP